MHKYYLIIILLLPICVFAQNTDQTNTDVKFTPQTYVGFEVTPTNTWLINKHDTDLMENEYSFGYQGGVRFGLMLNNNVGWSAFAQLSHAEQSYSGVDSAMQAITGTTKLGSAKLGLNLHIKSNPNNKLRFGAFAGPQFMLLFNYEDVSSYKSMGATEATVTTIKNTQETIETGGMENTRDLSHKIYTPFEFGVTGGIGIEFDVKDKFFVSIYPRVDLGIGDAENKKAKYLNGNGDPLNSYWTDRTNKYVHCSNASDFERCPPRQTTLNIAYGLQLGVNYRLN